MNATQQIILDKKTLQDILEPLIRRVIREELSNIVKQHPGMFFINSDMPIYTDMEELSQKRHNGTIELYSHEEVWGE